MKKSCPPLKLLITAGPTREYLDPVRFISNPSSGMMGVLLAQEAKRCGFDVFLILGPTHYKPSRDIKVCQVTSANEMFQEVKKKFPQYHILVMSAAVSDFRPRRSFTRKVKKSHFSQRIAISMNPDILAWAGKHKSHQLLVGFAAQTSAPIKNGRKKLMAKNVDLLVTNMVGGKDGGFALSWIKGALLDRHRTLLPLKTRSKKAFVKLIISHVMRRVKDL